MFDKFACVISYHVSTDCLTGVTNWYTCSTYVLVRVCFGRNFCEEFPAERQLLLLVVTYLHQYLISLIISLLLFFQSATFSIQFPSTKFARAKNLFTNGYNCANFVLHKAHREGQKRKPSKVLNIIPFFFPSSSQGGRSITARQPAFVLFRGKLMMLPGKIVSPPPPRPRSSTFLSFSV